MEEGQGRGGGGCQLEQLQLRVPCSPPGWEGAASSSFKVTVQGPRQQGPRLAEWSR